MHANIDLRTHVVVVHMEPWFHHGTDGDTVTTLQSTPSMGILSRGMMQEYLEKGWGKDIQRR